MDLISRQDALNAVRKCSVKVVTPAYMLIDKAEVMTELMNLPSAESDSDAEFWENRAAEYSKIIASLVADMSKGINFESMQITKTGKITFGRAEQELIHCGDCRYKDDGIDEDGIPFLKCLNGRSYGGTRINDYCSWAERRQE